MLIRSIFFISVLCFSCKTSTPETNEQLSSDHFQEWKSFRANPQGFFEMLGRTDPALADCSSASQYNEKLLDGLNDIKLSSLSAGRSGGLTLDQARELWNIVYQHPVTALPVPDKYDPQKRGIGFCFGRAMAAHLEAIWNDKFKLQNDRVRKLFVVGNLSAGGKMWQFHVTTLVKSDQGRWWAIDPILYGPVTAEAWYVHMKKFDKDGDMLLFHDDGMIFSANGARYSKLNLEDPFYNNYFRDLMNYYRSKFRDKRELRCPTR